MVDSPNVSPVGVPENYRCGDLNFPLRDNILNEDLQNPEINDCLPGSLNAARCTRENQYKLCRRRSLVKWEEVRDILNSYRNQLINTEVSENFDINLNRGQNCSNRIQSIEFLQYIQLGRIWYRIWIGPSKCLY